MIRDLIDRLPGIVYLYDLELNKLLYCNQALQLILGYTVEQLNQLGSQSIVFPDDIATYQAAMQKIAAQQEDHPLHLEYRVSTRDGQIRWLLDRMLPVERTPDNQPKIILGIATDTTTKHQEQEEFLQEIRHALESDEIKLYAQSVVDLHTEATVGVEVLVRWHHQRRGILLPGAFLPQLEAEPGLMTRFCIYVLSRSSQFLEGMPQRFVSVNVSPITFEKKGFYTFIRSIVQDANAGSGQLLLELTESIEIHHYDQIESLIQELQVLGVGVVLDDFGTGHNSLRNLIRFRSITKIKIDREFINELETSEGKAIVQAIISLAHGLGIGTVAEGIETQRQATILREMGCQLGQGYFFGKPTLELRP